MVEKIILDNGIRVVCEKVPYSRSVCVGVWLLAGSVTENPRNMGISHFVEHMLFKGTHLRSARDIAEAIDNIGGQINAFTSKECTCYHVKVRDTHLDIGLNVLSDIFFDSVFEQENMDIERNVIYEEINMYQDTPEELVYDLMFETAWSNSPLGYPVLGSKECLQGISRTDLIEYIQQFYTPQNMVISVAGNYNKATLMKLVKKYFGKWSINSHDNAKKGNAYFKSATSFKQKDIEQVHICMGFKGMELGAKDVYDLLAVNNIFGGSMSSRLFQEIREKKGLVYAIYSSPSFYRDAGLFSIYAGMNPECLKVVVDLIKDEVRRLVEEKISEEEIEKSKQQMEGNYILGAESISGKMFSMGKSELLLKRILTHEEVMGKINSVTIESAQKVVDNIFDLSNMSFSMVGNVKEGIS